MRHLIIGCTADLTVTGVSPRRLADLYRLTPEEKRQAVYAHDHVEANYMMCGVHGWAWGDLDLNEWIVLRPRADNRYPAFERRDV